MDSRRDQHYPRSTPSQDDSPAPAAAAASSSSSDGTEAAEMRLYLDKLKEIVPQCPKHRKVTRLELIQHVIDYICALQQALEERGAGFLGADLNFLAQQEASASSLFKNALCPRQPLGVLPLPENILVQRNGREPNRSPGQPKAPHLSSLFSYGSENG